MDVNLIVPAIQFGDEEEFSDRYRRFNTPLERNQHYEWLQKNVEPESMKSVSRVDLIIPVETIRVETLNEGDN